MAQFSESQLSDARTRWDVVAADLALKRKGREFYGLCPFHNEKTPSFYVTPDKGFFHCFGCGAHGDVIGYVMRAKGLDFVDSVRHILGLPAQPPRQQPVKLISAPAALDEQTAEDMQAIIDECEPINERTAAFMYLHMRALGCRQEGLWFHRSLECAELGKIDPHGPFERGNIRRLPAIVAPITNSEDKVTAILRTWLVDKVVFEGTATDPKDNRAPLRTRKKSLGVMGDGAVRLAWPSDIFGLAEGWETALSASKLFTCPVWATCGTARFGFPEHWRERKPPPGQRPRMWFPPEEPDRDVETVWLPERPPSIWLPPEARRIVVFGDNGETGQIVANHAVNYWRRAGLRAFARFPQPQFGDFNDQLRARPG